LKLEMFKFYKYKSEIEILYHIKIYIVPVKQNGPEFLVNM